MHCTGPAIDACYTGSDYQGPKMSDRSSKAPHVPPSRVLFFGFLLASLLHLSFLLFSRSSSSVTDPHGLWLWYRPEHLLRFL